MRKLVRNWLVLGLTWCVIGVTVPVSAAGAGGPGGASVPNSVKVSPVVGQDIRVSGVGASAADIAPAVAYNPTANQYLVVWEDERNMGARGTDIYGRRVAANGKRLGGEVRISDPGATTDDNAPAVAYSSTANQYLVVWEDQRNGGTWGREIYGRRVAANGSRVGGGLRVTGDTAHSDESAAAVAYNSTNDQYLVVWKDYRNNATRQTDIFGQRVRADGTRAGSDFRVSGGAAIAYEESPAVAYNLIANQYLVVWEDYRNQATRQVDIYGRRLAANGSPMGRDFRVSGGAAILYEYAAAVAYNQITNQYLVVWKDSRNTATGAEVYGRRVAADGKRVGFDFRINRRKGVYYDHSLAVAHNPAANQFLVVWEDWRNQATRDLDIYGRRVAG